MRKGIAVRMLGKPPQKRIWSRIVDADAEVVVLWYVEAYDYHGPVAEFFVATAKRSDLRILRKGPLLLVPRVIPWSLRKDTPKNGVLIEEHQPLLAAELTPANVRRRAWEIGRKCLNYLRDHRKK